MSTLTPADIYTLQSWVNTGNLSVPLKQLFLAAFDLAERALRSEGARPRLTREQCLDLFGLSGQVGGLVLFKAALRELGIEVDDE